MTAGYFDDKNREYVITTPELPVKWINYLGSLDFGGFVDHNGGGVLCQGDPALNRICKYIPQLPSGDMNGQTAYVRVLEGGDYKVFSPFYSPVLEKLDSYECRVGLGYNRYTVRAMGLECEVTVFIPHGERREIRLYKITNISKNIIEVDLIPVVEYTHFDALKQFTNADWVPQTMQSRLIENSDGLKVLSQYAFMKKGIAENYFSSDRGFSSFESDRAVFLGRYGYGSWKFPDSLKNKELANSQANRGDNIAALMIHGGVLHPGESFDTITQLGQTADISKEWSKIDKFFKPGNVKSEQKVLANFWSKYLDVFQVETPDSAFNSMINIHNPHQCYITGTWSRSLSSYQLGLGNRGLGFRDSSQDSLGMLSGSPEASLLLIEKLLSVQCSDGHAMHQFFPLTMEANEGDSREDDDRPDYYGDDHLWIVLAVIGYVKETGDFSFLDKRIKFYDSTEEASVLEHLTRSLSFTKENTGSHGLPLLGFADWNDTINLPTGAESFFIANLYGTAVNEIIGLFDYLGNKSLAADYRKDWTAMQSVFKETAWDGAWYKRYFDENGLSLGSHKNQYGQIYVNGQSWSVISGFASKENAIQALDSVAEKLNTVNGIKLSSPGYNGFDDHIGGVSTYPPGAKENGGIFLHSNPWMMIAETIMGNGDRAFQYYKQINPAEKNDNIEMYELEPYVYAQNFLGDEHPQFGLARNSWLSGTASWVYQAASKYILGILPDYNGLWINPCIPKNWNKFNVRRTFRGRNFDIKVWNKNGTSKGVSKVFLNGELLDSNFIPLETTRDKNLVEVFMV